MVCRRSTGWSGLTNHNHPNTGGSTGTKGAGRRSITARGVGIAERGLYGKLFIPKESGSVFGGFRAQPFGTTSCKSFSGRHESKPWIRKLIFFEIVVESKQINQGTDITNAEQIPHIALGRTHNESFEQQQLIIQQ